MNEWYFAFGDPDQPPHRPSDLGRGESTHYNDNKIKRRNILSSRPL